MLVLIVEIMKKKHEYYGSGSKVAEIADLSSLLTEIHVSKSDLAKLKAKNTKISYLLNWILRIDFRLRNYLERKTLIL